MSNRLEYADFSQGRYTHSHTDSFALKSDGSSLVIDQSITANRVSCTAASHAALTWSCNTSSILWIFLYFHPFLTSSPLFALFFCSRLTSLRLLSTPSLSSLSITPSSLNACGYWLCGVRVFQPHENLMAGIISPLNWACFAFTHSHIQQTRSETIMYRTGIFSLTCMLFLQSVILALVGFLSRHTWHRWMDGRESKWTTA